MHGDRMAVDYSVLNSGSHVLISKELTGRDRGNAIFEERSVLELKMQKNESLSYFSGFQCQTLKKEFCYGVIDKTKAREKKPFHPERAWLLDHKAFKFVPIKDIKTVHCVWDSIGDSQYPFK